MEIVDWRGERGHGRWERGDGILEIRDGRLDAKDEMNWLTDIGVGTRKAGRLPPSEVERWVVTGTLQPTSPANSNGYLESSCIGSIVSRPGKRPGKRK